MASSKVRENPIPTETNTPGPIVPAAAGCGAGRPSSDPIRRSRDPDRPDLLFDNRVAHFILDDHVRTFLGNPVVGTGRGDRTRVTLSVSPIAGDCDQSGRVTP